VVQELFTLIYKGCIGSFSTSGAMTGGEGDRANVSEQSQLTTDCCCSMRRYSTDF